MAKVKAHLASTFDVRDLGEAIYFLGMELTRDPGGADLEARTEEADGGVVRAVRADGRHGRGSTPLGTGEKLMKEGEPLDTAKFPYSKLVGSLLYLSSVHAPGHCSGGWGASALHERADGGALGGGARGRTLLSRNAGGSRGNLRGKRGAP